MNIYLRAHLPVMDVKVIQTGAKSARNWFLAVLLRRAPHTAKGLAKGCWNGLVMAPEFVLSSLLINQRNPLIHLQYACSCWAKLKRNYEERECEREKWGAALQSFHL